MSRNSAALGAHFLPLRDAEAAYIGGMDPLAHPRHALKPPRTGAGVLACAWLLGAGFGAGDAGAQAVDASQESVSALQSQVEGLLRQRPAGSASAGSQRVEITLGQIDPRMRLAPCQRVKAYLPDGAPWWGRTRVGLRCEQGTVRWNVYWPVQVKVWGQALVATVPLKPGVTVSEADVTLAEVDLAESGSPALLRPVDIVGRSVVRPIPAGRGLRQDDVKARRWFAAGDPVRLHVKGQGFMVAAEGVAMGPGDEGRCARVRTEQGRILCGQPVGDRLVEVTL